MKKLIFSLFLMCTPIIFANEQEDRGQELCLFTENIFNLLQENSEETTHASLIENLKQYDKNPNPEIASLSKKFLHSFTDAPNAKETLIDAVSELGRLLKCSVDDTFYRADTSYLLHRKDLDKQVHYIEAKMGDLLPKGRNVDYHKLMMESVAEGKYTIALYAYLKIATNRCIADNK